MSNNQKDNPMPLNNFQDMDDQNLDEEVDKDPLEDFGKMIKERKQLLTIKSAVEKMARDVCLSYTPCQTSEEFIEQLASCDLYIDIMSFLEPTVCPLVIKEIENPFDKAAFVIKAATLAGVPELLKKHDLVHGDYKTHIGLLSCLLTACAQKQKLAQENLLFHENYSMQQKLEDEPVATCCTWFYR